MKGVERFLRIPVRQSEGKNEGGASFIKPVFDDEYYGRDQAGGKTRTIGLILGVLVGAVIAGTATWFVFGPGGAAERGQTPLIAAAPEPFKVRPDDPGGLKVENQDKLVYERLSDSAPKPTVESILPPPEAPKAPIIAQPDSIAVESLAPEELITNTSTIAPPEPDIKVATATPEEPRLVTNATDGSATPEALMIPEPQSVRPNLEQTEQASPEVPIDQGQSLENLVVALSGDYLIQMAALRSKEAALEEWDRMSRKHSRLLGAYRPVIVKADLGERGIYYRLRAGPLGSRSDAEQLCSALAAEKLGCLIVSNE
ncbi:MAG: SPOR domain-containing protein [Rhodospirillaceae bacterium]